MGLFVTPEVVGAVETVVEGSEEMWLELETHWVAQWPSADPSRATVHEQC